MREEPALLRSRSTCFIFRLPEDEARQLKRDADLMRLSRAAYIRRLIREKKPLVREDPALQIAVKELNRIGVNLNQLTKLAHETNGLLDPRVLEFWLQRLELLRGEITRRLKEADSGGFS